MELFLIRHTVEEFEQEHIGSAIIGNGRGIVLGARVRSFLPREIVVQLAVEYLRRRPPVDRSALDSPRSNVTSSDFLASLVARELGVEFRPHWTDTCMQHEQFIQEVLAAAQQQGY